MSDRNASPDLDLNPGSERQATQDSSPDGVRTLRRGSAMIAYRQTAGQSPGVMFLTGFHSDMTGQKATALEAWAVATGRGFVRFDYQGHGVSSGRFAEGTLGTWIDDAVAVLDHVAAGPQILVGSSMGGWIMVRVAQARPDRVAGLVGIAAAPDFTEDLIWAQLDAAQRQRLLTEGFLSQATEYGDDPYPLTRMLVEEARSHLVLRGRVALDCPVRLIHGMADADVPWQTSLRLMERLRSADVRLVLVKDGEHRLSRPEDLALLERTVAELASSLTPGGGA